MKLSAVLLAGWAHAAVALAGSTLQQPVGSGLALAAQDQAAQTATFSGRTAIHGILVAQWLRSPDNKEELQAQFYIFPVPQSAASLPQFQGNPLAQITVTNGLQTLERATSPSIATEFSARQRTVVHVEGIYAISGVKIGVPCLAGAMAKVEEADPIRVRFPARAEPVACIAR